MDAPKTARGRQTRAAIIQAAADLMYRRGVHATSLDDVLDAAGCGKSQLYHYFAGRSQLLAAVVEFQLQGILGDQRSYDLDTWRGLSAWFDSLVARQQKEGFRGCPLGSLVSQMLAEDDQLQDAVDGAFADWEHELTLAFARMRATGRLGGAAQPGELARRVLTLIQGGYLLSAVRRDPRPMREAVTAAYEHLRSAR